ncbi:TonB-dependent receptor [Asticcacaulis solisilvae]|uniref:TonB-dependent receptor n=1 Tax=Asticcacaulis solisilvae TaxID=1217274 RepID=UPI003FD7538C
MFTGRMSRVWALSTVAAIAISGAAHAEETKNIDIPPQALGSALEAFGQQANVEILFDRKQLEGRTSPGLKGAFTPSEALKRLIQGTGASFNQPNPTTFVVSAAGPATADSGDSGVVVVKGYKASLLSAQNMKKNSSSIVDTVVAEDIGKLPDNNAAESMARIPGVQISRSGDEGNAVLVRGLPDVTTTVNGRDISTGEQRRVAMQDFPSGALASIEVYKSATADLLDPGLGGLVNVRMRKPFDFKGFEINGATRVTYNDQNGKFDPNGNILITNRWQTSRGEMGALINLSYSEQNFRNSVRWSDQWIANAGWWQATSPASAGNTFYYPSGVGVYNDSGLRKRPSANTAFQWKVSDNLEVYAEGLWQAYRASGADDWARMSLNDAASLTNVVLDPDQSNQALSFTKPSGGGVGDFYQSVWDGRTDTSQVAVGGTYTKDRLKVSTDFAYTDSIYSALSWSLDSELKNSPTVEVSFNDNGGTAFSLPGLDVSDPGNYVWRGYFESIYKVQGNGIQWRGDVVYQLDWGIIKNVSAGLRYTNRDASLRSGNRYGWTLPLALPYASVPFGDLALTQDTFRENTQGFRHWLEPSIDGVRGNIGAIEAATTNALQTLVNMYPNDQWRKDSLALWTKPLDYNPLWGFHARESTRTGYVQTRYETQLFGMFADGVVGARVVNTIGDYSGISSVTAADGSVKQEPRTSYQNYVDVLPNLSLRLKPTSKLQLRFAVTKTRTRPEFSQLNPALTITQILKTSSTAVGTADAYGSAGNPDLKPLTSTNYDATVEYYAPHGAAGMSLFYKDLNGFIFSYSRRVQDPTYGAMDVTRPENAGEGRIAGIEVGGQSFLDFLPGKWSGLGIQANATYLDGKNRMPNADGTFGKMVVIPNVSTWSYNLAIYYEKDKISTRLSYNGRSKWINGYNQVLLDAGATGQGTEGVDRLDFSFNYSPTDKLTVNFDVSNILARPFHNYNYYQPGHQFPIDIRDEGRYYGISLRYRIN